MPPNFALESLTVILTHLAIALVPNLGYCLYPVHVSNIGRLLRVEQHPAQLLFLDP